MKELTTLMTKAISGLAADALRVAAKNPAQLAYLTRFAAGLDAAGKLREGHEADGLHVPPFLIASITQDCNLACAGCYARANAACGSQKAGYLCAEKWESIFAEAEGLGVSFILLAGGEPLLRQDVLAAAGRHEQIVFPVFTNGTMADEGFYALLKQHRNVLPIISVEGGEAVTDARRGAGVHAQVAEVMGRLKCMGILFGTSITVTKTNLREVTGDDFARGLRKAGCSILFYVEYVPADGQSDGEALTEEDRKLLEDRLADLRQTLNSIIISFPGDEELFGGCLAAGRGFVHINSSGGLEPCPFSPYSADALGELSLAQALRSPFLARIREMNLTDGHHVGGCVLYKKRAQVQELLAER